MDIFTIVSHKYKYVFLFLVIQGINWIWDGNQMVYEDCVYELDKKLRETAGKRKEESDYVLEAVYEILTTNAKPKSAIYLSTDEEQ